MKYIEKQQPTKVEKRLKAFIKKQQSINQVPHYMNFGNDDGRLELHEALLEEQGYICAYCMQRIDKNGKIEHWDGQSQNPASTLDYRNMLAVCRGKSQDYTHCDTKRSEWQSVKGGGVLTLNPTQSQSVSQIKYLKNGTIYCDNSYLMNEDKENLSLTDSDLQYHLNLNLLFLRDNRASVYGEIFQIIRKFQNQRKSQDFIQTQKKRLLAFWQQKYKEGYKPYCGVAIYFLTR